MTIDKTELKAIAEACKDRQPLRFMRSHGALYIRNDNGIVFDVHQNRSFPEFMAQNKDYADLVLACTPAAILALLGEIEELRDTMSLVKDEDLKWKGLREQETEIKQLKAENEALRTTLSDCAASLEGEMLQKFAGQRPEDMHPVTRREYDRDMAELAGYRAAMAKEASHG